MGIVVTTAVFPRHPIISLSQLSLTAALHLCVCVFTSTLCVCNGLFLKSWLYSIRKEGEGKEKRQDTWRQKIKRGRNREEEGTSR